MKICPFFAIDKHYLYQRNGISLKPLFFSNEVLSLKMHHIGVTLGILLLFFKEICLTSRSNEYYSIKNR